MRFSIVSLVVGTMCLSGLAGGALAQSVALPLRGEGEVDVPAELQDVSQGSVLLQADSSVRILFLEAGTPRTVLTGRWRMTDRRTAELAVHAVLGSTSARGTGVIRFRPDGSVDGFEAGGVADGQRFAMRFENALTVALNGRRSGGSRSLEDEFPWGGDWAVVNATRRGAGRLTDAAGRAVGFDRARLTLGENDEFLLVLEGDSRAAFAGTWEGDLRDNPVRLQLREAMGERVGGVGRAWLRKRSWDRDWSFQRVELAGWNDDGGDALTLYFEAHGRTGEP